MRTGVSPLNLGMHFEDSLPENVILLMLEEFESVVACSAHGQVVLKDYDGDG